MVVDHHPTVVDHPTLEHQEAVHRHMECTFNYSDYLRHTSF